MPNFFPTINLCTFLCRSLPNSNVPCGIDRWQYIFSLSSFSDRFALCEGLLTYEIRE